MNNLHQYFDPNHGPFWGVFVFFWSLVIAGGLIVSAVRTMPAC